MPPDPLPLSSERAFARAHPELATLATAQIREAHAIMQASVRTAANELQRIEMLRRWLSQQGIEELPLDE